MYPHFPEAIELIAEHPIEVTVNSNCTMLNDRVIPGLMSLHALNLKASIDAATPRDLPPDPRPRPLRPRPGATSSTSRSSPATCRTCA